MTGHRRIANGIRHEHEHEHEHGLGCGRISIIKPDLIRYRSFPTFP
jgi:hypothetical protein